jgi:hypothetical protein
MSSIKHITLSYDEITFTTWISASMSDDRIYDKLREPLLTSIGGNQDSIICDPTRDNEKVQLDFHALKQGKTYLVQLSDARVQGNVPASASAIRTQQNLAYISAAWGMHADNIFDREYNMVPPVASASSWSRNFSDAMRTLASKIRGRHAKAMELLREAMNRRDDRVSSVATITDVLGAAKAAGLQLAGMADAAWGGYRRRRLRHSCLRVD